MNSFRLLWAILGPDQAIETSLRGNSSDASLDETMACLDEVLGHCGLVELVVVDPAETGPRGIQVRTDGGRSIITLAEIDTKKENNIRAFRSGAGGEEIEIIGEKWNSRLVCTDNDVVRKIFSELFSTGDVPTELMS